MKEVVLGPQIKENTSLHHSWIFLSHIRILGTLKIIYLMRSSQKASIHMWTLLNLHLWIQVQQLSENLMRTYLCTHQRVQALILVHHVHVTPLIGTDIISMLEEQVEEY